MSEAVKEDKVKVPEIAKIKAERPPKKKRSRPTNCAQSNKRIRRKDWYYRNGKYFANKQAFKLYLTQEAEKSQKAKEAAAERLNAAKPAPGSE